MIQYLDVKNYKNIFICGDIHGCYSLLMSQLKKFNFKTDLLLCTGDIIDRGPENLKCISLLSRKWFKTVKGNHEQFCIEGYTNPNVARIYFQSHNGGEWFYKLSKTKQKNILKKI